MKKKLLMSLLMLSLLLNATGKAFAADAITAKPTASTVIINGKIVEFEAYNISGNNFFKLRDLAYSLSGTKKQFEVTWDGANNAINLTSGKPYTAVGGEMKGKGAENKSAIPTSSKVILNGKEIQITAYKIEGSNFFKLRDIMETFDVFISYDEATKNISIDTNMGYEQEKAPWQFTPQKDAEPMESVYLKALLGDKWKAEDLKWTEEMISALIEDMTMRGYVQIICKAVAAKEVIDIFMNRLSAKGTYGVMKR